MFLQKPKPSLKYSYPNITQRQTPKALENFQRQHDNYKDQLSTEFPTINVEDIFSRHDDAILPFIDSQNHGLMTSTFNNQNDDLTSEIRNPEKWKLKENVIE